MPLNIFHQQVAPSSADRLHTFLHGIRLDIGLAGRVFLGLRIGSASADEPFLGLPQRTALCVRSVIHDIAGLKS